MYILTITLGKFIMGDVSKVSPFEVAGDSTEVRVDGEGGELSIIVAQHRTVYDHVSHPYADKGPAHRRLKHWATCVDKSSK